MEEKPKKKKSLLSTIWGVILLIVVGVCARSCGEAAGRAVAGSLMDNGPTEPKETKSIISIAAVKKIYTIGELSIFLPEGFEEEPQEGFVGAVFSQDTGVMWNSESFDLFRDAGIDPDTYTLDEYINLLYQTVEGTDITLHPGLEIPYLTYLKDGFGYCVCVYKGINNFWIVNFFCEEGEFQQKLPDYLEWAETVIVTG